MSTWEERKSIAEAHELTVRERLKGNGWQAFKFGQTLLPLECVEFLKAYINPISLGPSRLRWFPDIIAFSNRKKLALIDAKTELRHDTDNHSIELEALDTAEAFILYLRTPTYFVFENFTVMTPFMVRANCATGQYMGSGSGTPFVLVAKRFGIAFNDVFEPIRGDQR